MINDGAARNLLETSGKPPCMWFPTGFWILLFNPFFKGILIMNNPETRRRFPAAPSMTDHMVRIIKIAIYLKFLALYRAIEMMIRLFYLRQI